MIPLGADRFRPRGTPVTLPCTRTGSAVTLREEARGTRAVDFVRVDAPLTDGAAIAAVNQAPEAAVRRSLTRGFRRRL